MPLKVLLVDDDGDQLSLRGMLLRQRGFETCEATDPCSALELAAACRPDCAVVDLHLPTEEAGLELIRSLKANYPVIYVIVLTGKASRKLAATAPGKLVDEVLIKGSSARELVEHLNAFWPRRASELG